MNIIIKTLLVGSLAMGLLLPQTIAGNLAVDVGDYTGSRTSVAAELDVLSGTLPITFSWVIVPGTTKAFEYTYTLDHSDGTFSFIINFFLEVDPGSIIGDFLITHPLPNGGSTSGTATLGPLDVLKMDTLFPPASPLVWVIETDHKPVWGDFKAVDGSVVLDITNLEFLGLDAPALPLVNWVPTFGEFGSFPAVVVPEPTTMILLGTTTLMAVAAKRRQR